MNVLFDITRLGTAWLDYTPKTKRGIFRVVEELAKHLSLHPDVRLFVSSLTKEALCGAAWWYTKAHLRDFPLEFSFLHFPREVSIFKALALKIVKPVVDIYRNKRQKNYQIRSNLGFFSSSNNDIRKVLGDVSVFDIVHLPFFTKNTLPNLSIPLVITIHDLIPLYSQEEDPSLKAFLKQKIAEIRKEHWVHCISEATKSALLQYAPHLDPQRIWVIPNGVSSFFYREDDSSLLERVLNRYGLSSETPYIVSLCSIQKRKNLIVSLKAFACIQKELPDLRYLLVGYISYEERRELFSIISELGISSKVIVTGYLPDTIVRTLYSGAKAFLFPSLYEGFGLPPLEAMACGVPVICSNTSSLPEVVGDAGFLVDPHDVQGFADSIFRLISDESLWFFYSKKGIERAARFTWKFTAEKLVKMYKTILSGNPSEEENVL